MKRILFFLLLSISIYSSEVLIYGDPMTDYVTFVDEAFLDSLPGEKSGSSPVNLPTFNRLIKNYTAKCTGGSAVNTLKGLASLGHPCTVIGRIGEDEEGLNLAETLLSRGISHHYTTCAESTGKVVCMISPDGHRTMRSHVIDITPFETTPTMFKGIKLFHVEGYQIFNPPFLKSLISQAKQAGALVSMDVGCFEICRKYHDAFMDLITNDLDIVFTNSKEARILTSLKPKEACQALGKQCKIAVVTTGDKGGYVASNGEVFHYDAVCVDLVDDTAAGDYFIAGFLHGLLKKQSLESCAEIGAEIASKIVQVVGSELPAQ